MCWLLDAVFANWVLPLSTSCATYKKMEFLPKWCRQIFELLNFGIIMNRYLKGTLFLAIILGTFALAFLGRATNKTLEGVLLTSEEQTWLQEHDGLIRFAPSTISMSEAQEIQRRWISLGHQYSWFRDWQFYTAIAAGFVFFWVMARLWTASLRRLVTRQTRALYQSEKEFRNLFEHMLDGLVDYKVILDDDGKMVDCRFISINPAFEALIGLKADEVIGKTVLEVQPITETFWIEKYAEGILAGEPVRFENYSMQRGKYFRVYAYCPAPGKIACVYEDITDFKHAEEERNRLNDNLVAKNAELEQVLYVATHDLRSPLVNIDGYSKELNYAFEDLHRALTDSKATEIFKIVAPLLEKDIPEALRFIRASASKMDALLTGLLRLSRMGRAALKIEVLDMNKLIGKVIDSSEFQIKKAQVKLEVTDLPPCQSDAVQVNQLFSNLLDNALKYLTPDQPGVIRISGQIDGERAVYCVQDNGVGISPTHQGKIFEIFHRLDPLHGQGEGLGLTIVRRIADRLGGAVWVDSDIGIGSRFYLELPIKQVLTGLEKKG